MSTSLASRHQNETFKQLLLVAEATIWTSVQQTSFVFPYCMGIVVDAKLKFYVNYY